MITQQPGWIEVRLAQRPNESRAWVPVTSYDDTFIGTTGARTSRGCIRLHDADLALLAGLPAGTPLTLDIVA